MTYEDLFYWERLPAADSVEKVEYRRAASLMVVPQFRGYFSVLEKLAKDSNFKENEFCFCNSSTFINANMGGCVFNRE